MGIDSKLGFKISRQQRQQLVLGSGSQHRPYYQATLLIESDANANISADVIHSALSELVNSHEILHTRFLTQEGMLEPLQKLELEGTLFNWSVIEAGQSSADAKPNATSNTAALSSEQDTDNPLIEAQLSIENDNRASLRLRLSALISDYRTLSQLAFELGQRLSLAGNNSDSSANANTDADDEIVQYVDFSEWQDEVVEEDEAAKQFWKAATLTQMNYPRLTAGANALSDPFKSKVQDTYPDSLQQYSDYFALPMAESSGDTFINHPDINARLLALWMTVLHRFSGAEELTCLVQANGRVSEDFQEALGPYSRLIPLTTEIAETCSGQQLQDQLKVLLAQVDSNQMSLPLMPELALSNAVGFECLDGQTKVKNSSMTLSLVDAVAINDGTNLKLSCQLIDAQWQGRIAFNYGMYSEDFIQVLVYTLQTLASTWSEDKLVKHQKLADSAEHMAFLYQKPLYDQETHIVALIEQVVANNPDKIAVEWEESRLSYGQLNKRANQLAHALISKDIGAGKSVGLYFERGLELAISMLAVLKTGAAFIGLDPQTPPQRLHNILQETDLLLIAKSFSLASILGDNESELAGKTLQIDGALNGFSDEIEANPYVDITPDSCAYILYTSGSTGKPKGVQITHRGISNYLQHAVATYFFRSTNKVAGAIVHTSIGFDLTITGLLAPLLAGKKVVMIGDSKGMEVLTDAIMAQPKKMMLKLTPAHLKALNPWLSTLEEPLPLAVLVVGGEALYGKDIAVCKERFPALKIYNEYGPTETTVGCSIYLCSGDLRSKARVIPKVKIQSGVEQIIPIGHPISGTSLHVLDELGQPLPRYCAGEMYIGGAGLASGYLNMPEMTASRFVELELPTGGNLLKESAQRLYQTGDLVRLDNADHVGLVFLGRNDSQIKIRGYRIELGEIESVLKSRLAVRDVVVNTRQNLFGDPDIVAYLETDDPITLESLQQSIAADLPAYMFPVHLVCLPQFPLTHNGKIDVAALLDSLQEQDAQKDIVKQPYAPPTNEVEQHLVDAYQTALGIEKLGEPVGIQDNFFALGGDSIRAVHVVSTANEHGYELKVEELFNNPTVAALALVVAEKLAGKAVQEATEMSSLLDELEGLSEEEVAQRLAELEEEK